MEVRPKISVTCKSEVESKIIWKFLNTTHKRECTQIYRVSYQWQAKTATLRDANNTRKARAI
jgi:hypothetical protein